MPRLADVRGLRLKEMRALPVEVRNAKLGSLRLPPLEALRLRPRTISCLTKAGYTDPPDRVSEVTLDGLLSLPGFGMTSLIDFLTAVEPYRPSTRPAAFARIQPSLLAAKQRRGSCPDSTPPPLFIFTIREWVPLSSL